ncbi:MAG TPA: 2-phospho-L-lactate transferase [Anaerolineales bacterium]|nr:2-phospho-L-lactate transferase [Anaerolineales bacterium]
MNIVALAGGVGGAKLADGLAQILPPENLTIIVNTGDDFEHLGVKICPDLDTVCYTLAGLANPVTGWGLAGESWNTLEGIATLGGPSWFRVGDRDLGTHLERTRRLRAGQSLSQITRDFCRAWGVKPTVLPMSNEDVPTIVQTEEGDLAFQEYFVRRQCHPRVKGFRFEGVQAARPAPGVLEALEGADAVVICPSNPWVSVDPILSVPGIRDLVGTQEGTRRKVVAVSPIIAGQTVKGPAAKMYAELGVEPSALAVARHYGGLLEGFVFDKQDMQSLNEIQALGIRPLVTDTLMKTPADRRRLAGEVLDFIAFAR